MRATGRIFSIIREINLHEIKQEAERRFTLLVAGASGATASVAELLGTDEDQQGVHPWIIVCQPLPLPQPSDDLAIYDLAIMVIEQVEMDQEEASALAALHEARIPVLVVVASDGAEQQVGAEIARPREDARALLPSRFDATELEANVVPTLLNVAPEDKRLALARQFPLVRVTYARQLIDVTARANALFAASTGLAQAVPILNIPFTAGDTVVLTKNQLVMAYKLALAAGREGEPRELMMEVVGVVGGAFFFRQIARQLIALVPVIGVVPQVAVAYAGTQAIGRTVYVWAFKGEELSREEILHYYREMLDRGRAMAESVVARVRARRRGDLPPADEPDTGRQLPDNRSAEGEAAPLPTRPDQASERGQEGWWRWFRGKFPF